VGRPGLEPGPEG